MRLLDGGGGCEKTWSLEEVAIIGTKIEIRNILQLDEEGQEKH